MVRLTDRRDLLGPDRRVRNSGPVLSLLPSSDKKNYPGSLPKGLRRASLNYITDGANRGRYVATAKLDGIRMLAILCHEGVYLISRAMEVYQTDCVVLPIPAGLHCIFDGELMDNRYFIAFDAMVVDGVDISQHPFSQRYNQLCRTLSGVTIPSSILFVPKRMHPLQEMSAVVSLLEADDTPHAFSIKASDAVHTTWASSVYGVFKADGLIFMDTTDSFLCTHSFGLLKWKRCATFDVLMDMRDLCTTQGDPRRVDQVQTYYWEYSERLGKSIRVPFVVVQTTRDDRVSVWQDRMQVKASGTVCVECFRDVLGWRIFRSRPEKSRSNSSRTITDTLWIDQERITFSDILYGVGRQTQSVLEPDDSSLQPIHGICNRLSWVGYTWAQSTDIGELELRLTHDGTPSVPAAMFHRIMERLEQTTSMIRSEVLSTDYTCGPVRVTSVGDTSYAIQKETAFVANILLPDLSPMGMRCALSYEHPVPSLDLEYVATHYTSRRVKRRWRFVHRETVAIDCTYVQTTDWRDSTVIVESYEIEIELIRSPRYSTLSFSDCNGLILSMVWRMLMYVLGTVVEKTNMRLEDTN